MSKQNIFCTLFGSNYLDKALVMYHSLVETECNFKIYILPMDEKCKVVLNDYNYSNIIVLNFDEFIFKYKLNDIYNSRNFGVFCWTCTPFLIDYVLTHYGESIATYIDADLYFYNNPQFLLDEMGDKTIQIVPHRYNPTLYGDFVKNNSGTYCVQFNTFKNTLDALELLHWWCEQCYIHCSTDSNGVYGDQGYLENWGSKSNVSVLKHLGGGVAPWNIAQYKISDENKSQRLEDKSIVLVNKYTLKKFSLIFYHFQGINYLSDSSANINVYEPWKTDVVLVKFLYKNYLTKIDKMKIELKEKYGIYSRIERHPAEDYVKEQKSFFCYLKILFSLLSPRQFYLKVIFKFLVRKYEFLNIIKY